MTQPLTAEQRLWLECLGLEASESADEEVCRAWLERKDGGDRDTRPPNAAQQRLAQDLGVELGPEASRRDAALKLFAVLMLRAWVYSVYRTISRQKEVRYDRLSLQPDTALWVARKMESAGMFEAVRPFPTTEARYDRLSLQPDTALWVARKMESAGMFEAVRPFPTTEAPEGDLFYVIDEAAAQSKPFQFVAGRLPTLPPSAGRNGDEIDLPGRPVA